MELTIKPVLASDFDGNSAPLVCIEGLHPIVLSCLVSLSMEPESGQTLAWVPGPLTGVWAELEEFPILISQVPNASRIRN